MGSRRETRTLTYRRTPSAVPAHMCRYAWRCSASASVIDVVHGVIESPLCASVSAMKSSAFGRASASWIGKSTIITRRTHMCCDLLIARAPA